MELFLNRNEKEIYPFNLSGMHYLVSGKERSLKGIIL